MKQKSIKLLNTIDNLYDTAYSVLESYEHDQQDLFVAKTERDIYKTAFNQLKKFVSEMQLVNLGDNKKSADYNMGKVNAYLSILNEIEIIEEVNGLVPVKIKKDGI